MKVILTKVLALGGLCVLFAGIGNTAASAQGYYRHDVSNGRRPVAHGAHQRIKKLQRVYAHSVHTGNTEAARRAHRRAQEIRERLREHRHFTGNRPGNWSQVSW